MSTPNVPQVQVLSDQNGLVTVLVTGYYTSANSSNTKIISANTLAGANTSRACVLSIIDCEYDMTLNNGFASIQYQGAAANADALILGGDSANKLKYYIPNPYAANTANLTIGFGDINLLISNATTGACFTMLLTFTKEGDSGGGYANSYIGYEAPGYPH